FGQYLIKLGAEGVIVQLDGKMTSYSVKSHRGRETRKQTWAITIVDTSTYTAKDIVKL
ncbi:hypothetical protein H312_00723, partial [Anncaliia algerae PRA339]